jgi:small subunit ribosomal protein S4
MITHGHFRINDRKVSIPSIQVKKGDIISLREKSAQKEEIRAILEFNKSKEVPGWLEVDRENMKIKVLALPKREDVTLSVEEHLIVELYSK